MAPLRRQWVREKIALEQLAPPVDRSKRLSYEELKAKYGDWTNELGPGFGAKKEEKEPTTDSEWDKKLRQQYGRDGE